MYSPSNDAITFDYLCSKRLFFNASGLYTKDFGYEYDVVSVNFFGGSTKCMNIVTNDRSAETYYIYDDTAEITDRVVKL
jgi:hypothetical protein